MGVSARIDMNGQRIAELWQGDAYAANVDPGKITPLVDAWSAPGYYTATLDALPDTTYTLEVIGNRQHALAILGHDGAHFTVHSNRSWNDFLSNLLCFWPLLITTEGYRKLHFIHHNNTGTSKDPELLHKKARAPQWNLPLNKRKILLYSFADIFGYSLPDLFIILTFSKPEKRVYFLPVILMHFSFLAASVYSGYWVLPLMWYGSLASTFMMFFRLRLWIEHQGTYGTQRIVLHPVQGMIFSPHKAWYHWEHHLFPTVPYHKLEKAREILNGPSPISLSQLLYKLMNSHPLPSGAMVDDPANLSVQN